MIYYNIIAVQGLTYAEVHITNQKEMIDAGLNGFLTCVSELSLNIGNYRFFFTLKSPVNISYNNNYLYS